MCSPTGTTRGWPRPPRSAPNCEPCSPRSTRTCFRWPTNSPPPVKRWTDFSRLLPWRSPLGIWRRTRPRSLRARSSDPTGSWSLLARGGMGDVYRATDPRLGRDVALKTLPKAEPDDAHAVERFVQEARVTASLDHPNIVKVFDVGMSNGRPYLVSELLEGETLRAPILQRAGRHRQTPAASPPRWRAAWWLRTREGWCIAISSRRTSS